MPLRQRADLTNRRRLPFGPVPSPDGRLCRDPCLGPWRLPAHVDRGRRRSPVSGLARGFCVIRYVLEPPEHVNTFSQTSGVTSPRLMSPRCRLRGTMRSGWTHAPVRTDVSHGQVRGAGRNTVSIQKWPRNAPFGRSRFPGLSRGGGRRGRADEGARRRDAEQGLGRAGRSQSPGASGRDAAVRHLRRGGSFLALIHPSCFLLAAGHPGRQRAARGLTPSLFP